MESEVNSASPTRRSGRARTKTPKAAELSSASAQGENNEIDQDYLTEIETEAPGAPRAVRTRAIPGATIRKGNGVDKGKNATTKDTLAVILAVMEELRRGNTELKATVGELMNSNAALRATVEKLTAELSHVKAQLVETKAQAEALANNLETQLSRMQAASDGSPTYAHIVRTPPDSQPSNLRTISGTMTPSAITDTIYCTIDTSRVEERNKAEAQLGAVRQAIEKQIREIEGQETWRCAAVTRDPKNTDRIRIKCRDETELHKVKEAAQKTAVRGVRVLRDQLYPVKVNNANRTAILDEKGDLRPEVMRTLGEENEVQIAKIDWLSRKDNRKAYGSMVIHVTRRSDAARLLREEYFHVAGESAYTRPFQPRTGPVQCYKCQRIGHKAFSCDKPQICAKCAATGNHHSECEATILKCVPCGGPHESFSRNCRVLYPAHHE
ncbi:hypothetical protein PMIN03_013091 [Paraphaeosphaeria minitans]